MTYLTAYCRDLPPPTEEQQAAGKAWVTVMFASKFVEIFLSVICLAVCILWPHVLSLRTAIACLAVLGLTSRIVEFVCVRKLHLIMGIDWNVTRRRQLIHMLTYAAWMGFFVWFCWTATL